MLDWLTGRKRVPGPFRMSIDDAFRLADKVVVVGVVAAGEVRPGDRLVLQTGVTERPVTVEVMESYHRPIRAARAGVRVGILLTGATKEQVGPGATLASVE